MIPTLLLAGLVAGRWWLVPIAAVTWPALLFVDGVDLEGPTFVLGAGALGAANTAVWGAVHWLAVLLFRCLRRFLEDPLGALGAHER